MTRPAPVESVFCIEGVVLFMHRGEIRMHEVTGLRMALVEVVQSLPNRHCCKSAVMIRASQYVAAPQDVSLVERFIRLSSRCWGIDRRQEYWQILLENFTPEEVLELYMKQCPKVVTRRQYVALQKMLMSRLQLPEEHIRQAMMWLTVKASAPRRRPKYHYSFVGCPMGQ